MVKNLAFIPFFVAPLAFFIIDLGALFIAQAPVFQTLVIFTLILFLEQTFFAPLFFCFLLISLFSCITVGLSLPYLALVLGILLLSKAAYLYTHHRFLVYGISTLTITYLSLVMLGSNHNGSLLTASIVGNLIALYVSLKWFSAVRQGNRS